MKYFEVKIAINISSRGNFRDAPSVIGSWSSVIEPRANHPVEKTQYLSSLMPIPNALLCAVKGPICMYVYGTIFGFRSQNGKTAFFGSMPILAQCLLAPFFTTFAP
jgi:hypothetical protein